MKLFKDKTGIILLLVVFATGASIMVFELAALRIFAPYFGNTLYTTSSVLGVVLGALACGYFFGGRLSDKYPSFKIFYVLIGTSGVLMLLLHTLHTFLLPLYAYSMSVAAGSLLFSLTFFFAPSLILGTLSPYVIKLRSLALSKNLVGKNAGEVFFASTVGSIVGSFLTGFYLIPTFGVNEIIKATSLFLLVLGGVGVFVSSAKLRHVHLLIIFAILTLALGFTQISFSSNFKPLYEKDGVYQKLTIYDSYIDREIARFLLQDRNTSSAMFLHSNELVFGYTKYIEMAKLMKPAPKTALVIGAGAYSVPKYLLDNFPEILVDVVEIEPDLYNLSKKYFNLKDNTRLTNITADGRRYLKETSKQYDLIFLDAYGSLFSIPAHLSTREFFELTKERLTRDGLVLANVIGKSNGQFLDSFVRTWTEVYPGAEIYAVDGTDTSRPQNFIFGGCLNTCVFNYNRENIIATKPSQGFLLTDNYVPVDYFMLKELEGELF